MYFYSPKKNINCSPFGGYFSLKFSSGSKIINIKKKPFFLKEPALKTNNLIPKNEIKMERHM